MRYALILIFALAVASPVAGQPKVGTIEVYGTRKISNDKIKKALGVSPGDPLPKSKGALEERLEEIDGVVRSRVEAFCCDKGGAVLYVGIEERGSNGFHYKPYPDRDLTLPSEVAEAYGDFAAALSRASAENDLKEDLTQGHTLLENLPSRVAQERFTGLAELHLSTLRSVLKDAAEPEQRAIAAYVIGYAPDKKAVVNDLYSALQDPDGSVRANAARALKAIAYYGMQDPERDIRVQPTWFVEMLNSLELSDRLESARALLVFMDKPDENVINNIRDRAWTSLLEMAHWQYLPHALPAYMLVGRVAGRSEEDLEKAWLAGDRDKVLAAIQRPAKK